jgi:hypothetical protein
VHASWHAGHGTRVSSLKIRQFVLTLNMGASPPVLEMSHSMNQLMN